MKRSLVFVDADPAVDATYKQLPSAMEGAAAIVFSDVLQARRWLSENPVPALVSIDLRVVGGVGLCRELRLTPRLSDIPLVVTSGMNDPFADDLSFELSAAYLPKPFTLDSLAASVTKTLASVERKRWPPRPRVLIVDDDQAIRNALKKIVDEEGWEAVCAEDGVEAISLLARGGPAPTLALIDVMMPGVDGVSLAKRLRRATGLGEMPVVIISGSDDIANRAQSAGAVAHLKKPFEIDELVAVMHDAVLGVATP